MLNQQWILIADRTKVLSAFSFFFLSEKKLYDAKCFVWVVPRFVLFITRHILMTDHTQLGWAIGQSGKKISRQYNKDPLLI
jgi:hypothetical protein